MFAVSPFLDVTWIDRRPKNASDLEWQGWLFLPLRTAWDAAAFDRLVAATELSAITPESASASQAWWCAFLRSYVEQGDLTKAIQNAADVC